MRAMKGKRQLTMLRVLTLEEAEAAERAGVDIVSIPPDLMLNPQYREVAPSLFSMPGDNFYEIRHQRRFRSLGLQALQGGADAVYCIGRLFRRSSASPTTISRSSAMSA